MRIAVTGATGNVGTAVLRALRTDAGIDEIVAIARRRPESLESGVSFVSADVGTDNLEENFQGIDTVIHLAWLIQPGRDEAKTWQANVVGSRRVFDAAVRAGIGAIVHASSVGAYSPGPKDREVGENWPTGGIATSFYSRHKVDVERELDHLAVEHPQMRVVRLRPGLIFQRAAATEIRRLFVGPLLPKGLMRQSLLPIVPDIPGLRVQAVHADDVADAYRRAALSDSTGAFNVAADPVIDAKLVASMVGARTVPVLARAARTAATAAFRMRLTPTEPGWLDLALGVPLLSSERARRELGWTPQHDAREALRELAEGLRDGVSGATPPLAQQTSGPLRAREFATGVGRD